MMDHARGCLSRRTRSLTARPRFCSQGGFTLIEILVVMVIIGILVTFATLSVGDRALDDKLKTEAQRIEQLLQIASEDAEQQGVEIGFIYTEDGYAFLTASPAGRWIPISNGPLRQRRLPPPMRMQMRVEDQIVAPISAQALANAARRGQPSDTSGKDNKPGQDAAKNTAVNTAVAPKDDKLALKPQALLLSSGEASALKLDLSAPGVATVWRVAVDELGHVQRSVLEVQHR